MKYTVLNGNFVYDLRDVLQECNTGVKETCLYNKIGGRDAEYLVNVNPKCGVVLKVLSCQVAQVELDSLPICLIPTKETTRSKIGNSRSSFLWFSTPNLP
jgi:hypothetical protein